MSHYINRQQWAEKRPQVFEFEVKVDEDPFGYYGDDDYGYVAERTPAVQVVLPHQCDGWEISRPDATKDEAIEDLQMFIAAAEDALAALKDLEVSA